MAIYFSQYSLKRVTAEQAHLILVLQLVLKRPLAQWLGHKAGPRLDACLAISRAAYRCPDGQLHQEAVNIPDKPGQQFTTLVLQLGP
jgi:hypothetical protein